MPCAFCDRDLNEADSCTKNVIMVPRPDSDDGGGWQFAVPFGDESRGIVDDLDLEPSARCHDRGVTVGGFHHPGCDVEESPLSGNQLLMDVISSDGDTRPYHARAQADPHHDMAFGDVVNSEN